MKELPHAQTTTYYQKKKRALWRNVTKFSYYLKERGLVYAMKMVISYLSYSGYIILEIRRHIRRIILKKKDIPKGIEEPADIMLIQSPLWSMDRPPLSIAYLSRYLRSYGYKTLVWDLNVNLYNLVKKDLKCLWHQKNCEWWINDKLFTKTWKYLKGYVSEHVEKILNKADIEYVGVSVNLTSIHFSIKLLRIVRKLKPKIKIIVGGWGCIEEHMRKLFPKELVDVFVIGEGEKTLVEVIEALRGLKDVNTVEGAIFNNACQQAYKPRTLIKNLDNIPWPTFKEFHLENYRQTTLPLLTSRGCVGNCSFCDNWPFSRPYRFRSAQNIFEEIKFHIKNNHIKKFVFNDLLCNGYINELDKLCDLLIKHSLKITWCAQAITRKEMTYDLLRKLRKSGCGLLIYGVESFSDNVLRGMKKMFTKEVAEKVLEDTHKAGIKVLINIIVGFPGETEKDFLETYEALKRNRRFFAELCAINVCRVNSGSALNANPENYEIILTSDPKTRLKEWISTDGKNTYELRKKRAEKILKLLKELKLEYEYVGI